MHHIAYSTQERAGNRTAPCALRQRPCLGLMIYARCVIHPLHTHVQYYPPCGGPDCEIKVAFALALVGYFVPIGRAGAGRVDSS